MKVAFADIDELKARAKIFDSSNSTKYQDADLLTGLAQTASEIEIILEEGRYPTPVTSVATWLLTAIARPDDGETVILGETYTFMNTPVAAYDVLRGADAPASMKNLAACVEKNRFGSYYADTPINNYLGAKERSGTAFTIFSRRYGTQGAEENVTAGTAPITVAVVMTGGAEFTLLIMLNIYLATVSLLGGKVIGKESGKSTKSLRDDFKDKSENIIAMLKTGKAIRAISGVTVSKPYKEIHIDEDV
jgi:hypothetical protein